MLARATYVFLAYYKSPNYFVFFQLNFVLTIALFEAFDFIQKNDSLLLAVGQVTPELANHSNLVALFLLFPQPFFLFIDFQNIVF